MIIKGFLYLTKSTELMTLFFCHHLVNERILSKRPLNAQPTAQWKVISSILLFFAKQLYYVIRCTIIHFYLPAIPSDLCKNLKYTIIAQRKCYTMHCQLVYFKNQFAWFCTHNMKLKYKIFSPIILDGLFMKRKSHWDTPFKPTNYGLSKKLCVQDLVHDFAGFSLTL